MLRNITYLFIIFFILLIFSQKAESVSEKIKAKIVFIHGFGGKRTYPKFSKKMHNFITRNRLKLSAELYSWDSVSISLKKVGIHWKLAKKAAEKETAIFRKNIINKYEKQGINYYLIGHSLGTKVIFDTLNCIDYKLKYLKGVFFLCSVVSHSRTSKNFLKYSNIKIINYYSKNMDIVLKGIYPFVDRGTPGGIAGFKNTKIFKNYEAHLAHNAYTLYPYDMLAEAIGYLISYNENIIIPGEDNYNLKIKTFGGKTFWNTVYKFNNFTVQQNINTKHYRAISNNKKHTRLAWGYNMHTILKKLKIKADFFR